MSDVSATMEQRCEVCEQPWRVRWTDLHGVAACLTCNTPYRIIHRDELKNPIQREPEIMIVEKWLPLTKRFWREERSLVAPGLYHMPGSDQDRARREHYEVWARWMDAHKDEWPAEDEDGSQHAHQSAQEGRETA